MFSEGAVRDSCWPTGGIKGMHSGGIKVSYPRLRSWFHLLLAESSRISHITSLNPTFLVCEMSLWGLWVVDMEYVLIIPWVFWEWHTSSLTSTALPAPTTSTCFFWLWDSVFFAYVFLFCWFAQPQSPNCHLCSKMPVAGRQSSQERRQWWRPLCWKEKFPFCHFPGTPPGSISTVGRFKVHGEITSNTFNSSFLTFSIPMTIVHTYSECGPTGDFKAC